MTTDTKPTERKLSTLELIFDHTRIVAFVLLAIIAIVALVTQNDKDMLRYVLGGCGTLAFLAAAFMSD